VKPNYLAERECAELDRSRVALAQQPAALASGPSEYDLKQQVRFWQSGGVTCFPARRRAGSQWRGGGAIRRKIDGVLPGMRRKTSPDR